MNRRLYKLRTDGYTSVESTVGQASIWRLHKRWFDDYASLESTIVLTSNQMVAQTSNRQLYKSRIDGCTSVDSKVAQASIWRLRRRRIDGYIDYFKKKSIKNIKYPFIAVGNKINKLSLSILVRHFIITMKLCNDFIMI